MKAPDSSSNSMKIKTLIHSLVFRHMCRGVVQALSNAKSMLIELLKENQPKDYKVTIKKNKKKRKKIFSSFKMHYNWCSSDVLPMPEPVDGFAMSNVYYDSTWNSIFPAEECDADEESQLSGYINWLEEKVSKNSTVDVDVDEINRLAEKFIASCHEKFRLEKQESYRRYQEMLDRSM
ncbi:hypothetical protein HHK36_011997 [Tetracentron sinense]|uniref:DUF761 domain-containing protein n=1 Tax=Tetracentron sinense TaxID=13715 RepID=A0A835DHT0_TETSI|nr:hypothetical protein HHK36_011997 [Tetracentron sinense]